ncbi:hypothetical protein FW778_13925 [Ginsengibacter hankyongi]|uniref:ATP-grasp domain-containing protein n=1 Tax=Ginsengibacter hankyongi TaxID=2607284 RepID=A0A5J5IHB8_9BACT|nr:hypothetical protein [Ginsengibacter hankyongi]KAA9038646.1 hypothetical protein FW778_13925 [Ginsengibacter hankyongi]
MNLIKKIKNWEQWPFKILYAPIVPVWVWYMIRSRAIWFFTPSNPKLTFGGMEGEPKKEMHDLLPPHLCPVYFNVQPSEDFSVILKKVKEKNISFPLIVKPEVGGQGILFRKINNEEQLKNYHEQVPVEYFVQEFIKYELEVSLFYYRYPNEDKGVITGFLQKIPMQVTGDGIHTLEELIMMNSKSGKRIEELRLQHESNFKRVIKAGDKYMLSYAANHNRGAQFIDLRSEIDERLLKILDEISHSVNDFFYGRYDIMCNSIEELKEGKNFVILEYNGCGAEPNHFYDTGYTLKNAWKEILKHWKVLYQISRYNYKTGIGYWSAVKGFRFRIETKKHYKIMKAADKKIP